MFTPAPLRSSSRPLLRSLDQDDIRVLRCILAGSRLMSVSAGRFRLSGRQAIFDPDEGPQRDSVAATSATRRSLMLAPAN